VSARKSRARSARILVTARAALEVAEIEVYSADRWGSATAETYVAEIESALERLAQNAGLLQLEPGLSQRLYFYRVRKHVLVCDYREKIVTVLTVIHTSIDLRTRLAELEPRLVAEVQLLHDRLHRGR
jgi:plasmid stabilization system protein ParE